MLRNRVRIEANDDAFVSFSDVHIGRVCACTREREVVCLQTPGMHASYAINIVTVSMLLFMSFFSQLL